jgi:hypothetical protein
MLDTPQDYSSLRHRNFDFRGAVVAQDLHKESFHKGGFGAVVVSVVVSVAIESHWTSGSSGGGGSKKDARCT